MKLFTAMITLALAAINVSNVSLAAESCSPFEIEIASSPIPPQQGNQLEAHYKIAQNLPVDAEVILLGDSHAAFFPERVWRERFPMLKAANLGVPGDKAQTTLWRLDHLDVEKMKPPSAVIIFMGTNMVPQMPVCAAVIGTRTLIDKASKIWPGAEVYVIKPPPRGPFLNYAAREQSEFFAGLIASGGIGQIYVDADNALNCGGTKWILYQARLHVDFGAEIQSCRLVKNDNIHLSKDGYEALAQVLSGSGGALSNSVTPSVFTHKNSGVDPDEQL